MTIDARTLLINGTDIKSFTGMIVNDIELFAPGVRRGQADVIGGRQGQVGARLVLDAYQFSVFVTIEGDDEVDLITNLRAVSAALYGGNNGLVSLTRRLPTGASTHVDHTANGQFYAGLGFNLLNFQTGQTELQFVNLSGAWWDGTAWVL